ncbi:MAG: phosphatidylglycerol lysyltransferase domain-containing protein [Planktotalea sp.]|uniref:phosphatidylglycerol lysyltransferase domain-containing protein n=1 Tax=Planktotalea sp. TaxID=2029877 RepID=UPI003C77258B
MSSSLPDLPFHRKALTQLAALCIVFPLCILAARPFLDALDWGQVGIAWRGITASQWSIALLATTASFASLGRYDVIIHRVLGTGVGAQSAQASGAAAVALSQTLGFGLITGTLARWRSLPGQSIVAAGSVTALVSFSFLGAWLMIFALTGLLASHSLPLPPLVFQASLFSALCFVLYSVLKRYLTIAGRRLRLPSLRAIVSLMLYAALDTGFAALALWILLPSAAAMPFSFLFPIYLACLGTALLGNTPGGLGPFEVTFLWALHSHSVNDLLAGLIAFRLIYFALPACIAMLYLIRPLPARQAKRPMISLARGLHPETPAALQTGTPLIANNGTMICAIARTSQTTSAIFDPAASTSASLAALTAAARLNATVPLFYKCSARQAAKFRAHGLYVARIAQDAMLDLTQSDLNTPSRRSLRRKLRAAAKANVSIARLYPNDLPLDELKAIDAQWQSGNGAARGFSMGRFELEYVKQQAIFGAYNDGRLIAFITCHASSDAWALDLMRSDANVPSGTMHALVWHAIEAAKAQECASFSLASASCTRAPLIQIIDKLSFLKSPNTAGLEQFKRSFAPQWYALYAAAPNRAALWLGLWDIWQEVQDPPPLRSRTRALRAR